MTSRDDIVAKLAELAHTLRALQMDAKGSNEAWLGLDVSMAQLKAMMIVLHSGGVVGRDLAEKMRIGPSAVTPLVDKLEQQKLVRREDDPQDRRVVWIRPTPKSLALHQKLVELSRASLNQLVDEVPAQQRTALADAVNILVDAARRVAARRTKENE